VALPQRRLARLKRAAGLSILLAALTASACGVDAPAPRSDAVDLSWALRPPQPVVGPVTLTVTLGEPHRASSGATVRVVGHMTHPGMAPAVATVTPRGDGAYDAKMDLTMAGDWVFVVTVQLADGRRIERRIDVPHVQAPKP
jgi:hypothetical protein